MLFIKFDSSRQSVTNEPFSSSDLITNFFNLFCSCASHMTLFIRRQKNKKILYNVVFFSFIYFFMFSFEAIWLFFLHSVNDRHKLVSRTSYNLQPLLNFEIINFHTRFCFRIYKRSLLHLKFKINKSFLFMFNITQCVELNEQSIFDLWSLFSFFFSMKWFWDVFVYHFPHFRPWFSNWIEWLIVDVFIYMLVLANDSIGW